jgi:hypothetical protein
MAFSYRARMSAESKYLAVLYHDTDLPGTYKGRKETSMNMILDHDENLAEIHNENRRHGYRQELDTLNV